MSTYQWRVRKRRSGQSALAAATMKDLTEGPITRHLVTLAMPVLAFMGLQALYFLVNLRFVADLGDAAIAGMTSASNVTFIVLSLTQVLEVGTAALISHAVGRKDRLDATLVFNQALSLSMVCSVSVLLAGYTLARPFVALLAADEATLAAAMTYLYWFMPALVVQFGLSAIGASLRGTGIVKPTMLVYVLTLAINVVLAPILIAGWGTGRPMGVAGAGLASSVAVVVGTTSLWIYFRRQEHYVSADVRQLYPIVREWKRILNVGLPAGAEMALMFLSTAVIYWAIRDFGASTQAGFGVGFRVTQALLLPAMAIAFAAGPITGQNFGASNVGRVVQTFWIAAAAGTIVMAAVTLFLQLYAEMLVKFFTSERDAAAVAAVFLHLTSLGFIARGLTLICSSSFQGLGNTRPALVSSAASLLIFLLPTVWLAGRPEFRIEQLWYLWIATLVVQATVSLLLLRAEFKVRFALLQDTSLGRWVAK